MQQRLRAIGGVPTPFAAPSRGVYSDYGQKTTGAASPRQEPLSYRMEAGGSPPEYSSNYSLRLQQPGVQRRVNSEGELLGHHREDAMNYSLPVAERHSPDNYHEVYSSASMGVYPSPSHGNSGPIPMSTAYRMTENIQDLGMVASSAKSNRSKAPTSSVYEANYEISV